tara:strand:+ start:342 stop:803 length:462 start_codon:yes stop_codon:yes gene_type:complete
MSNEWYIQIFRNGKNKKETEIYNIIENKTINKQEIGIGFCDNNPILVNNKMIDINNIPDLSNRQNLYRKRMFEYFINTMKIGDIIYLKNGREILYKATIASDYYYNDSEYYDAQTVERHNNWFWRHRRKIKDIEKIYEIKPGYSRQTLYCKKK